jgi:hypothetical protein
MVAECACSVPVRDAVVRLTPEQRSECMAKGGDVELVSITAEGCVVPTTDGGEACSDSSQCQGACIAPFAAKTGAVVAGTCATKIGEGGCINVLIHGKASGEACFD